jgi:hypothetical protein
MTPRDRIAILLHHYRDVCEGIRSNKPRGDELIIGMCEEWNHPAYQQLERLLVEMHQFEPRLRQALRQRFERYSERRVAWCKACNAKEPAFEIGAIHVRELVAGKKLFCRQAGKTVTLQPRIVRVFPTDDDPAAIGDAIDWLERHWTGIVDLPDAVIAYTSAVALREAA